MEVSFKSLECWQYFFFKISRFVRKCISGRLQEQVVYLSS